MGFQDAGTFRIYGTFFSADCKRNSTCMYLRHEKLTVRTETFLVC